jgi:hypothetical protein
MFEVVSREKAFVHTYRRRAIDVETRLTPENLLLNQFCVCCHVRVENVYLPPPCTVHHAPALRHTRDTTYGSPPSSFIRADESSAYFRIQSRSTRTFPSCFVGGVRFSMNHHGDILTNRAVGISTPNLGRIATSHNIDLAST